MVLVYCTSMYLYMHTCTLRGGAKIKMRHVLGLCPGWRVCACMLHVWLSHVVSASMGRLLASAQLSLNLRYTPCSDALEVCDSSQLSRCGTA